MQPCSAAPAAKANSKRYIFEFISFNSNFGFRRERDQRNSSVEEAAQPLLIFSRACCRNPHHLRLTSPHFRSF
jgi:hypothetical protein